MSEVTFIAAMRTIRTCIPMLFVISPPLSSTARSVSMGDPSLRLP